MVSVGRRVARVEKEQSLSVLAELLLNAFSSRPLTGKFLSGNVAVTVLIIVDPINKIDFMLSTKEVFIYCIYHKVFTT